jgi:hypothetical protein
VKPVKYWVIISLFRFLEAFFNRENLIIKHLLQITLHLIRTSRLWTLLLLGLEVFLLSLQNKATSTVSTGL